MRAITLRRHDAPAPITPPDAAKVYEAALEWLGNSHENEAATCLACCELEIVSARGTYPLREELQPVRLILIGPGSTMSLLERSPEIRGRVRQALDNALGPTVYLTQLALSTSASALAA
jgi:hypothetical protein